DNSSLPIGAEFLETVGPSAPEIVTQPEDATVPVGRSASFSVGVRAVPGTTYQWFFDNAAVADATNTSVSIGPLAAADNGKKVKVEVRAGGTTLISRDANVTVFTP